MTNLPDTCEPAFMPYKLEKKWDYDRIRETILEAIDDGLPVVDAFKLAGISEKSFYNWKKYYQRDLENGYSGTRFIMLMNDVAKRDGKLKRRISKALIEKGVDEKDTRVLMYLADNRLGYANRRKNQVELGSKGQNNIQINVIDMKSNEVDEDIEEIEVHGECRDDSNSTEMD